MWNDRLDEAQAGIQIAVRNINNLRYADDTTLMGETKEELKSLLMEMKEESEKAGLTFNIQKLRQCICISILYWCFSFWRWNMYNIIYEMNRQSKFDAWYWMLEADALRWPRGMVRGGRKEGDSGTRVYCGEFMLMYGKTNTML